MDTAEKSITGIYYIPKDVGTSEVLRVASNSATGVKALSFQMSPTGRVQFKVTYRIRFISVLGVVVEDNVLHPPTAGALRVQAVLIVLVVIDAILDYSRRTSSSPVRNRRAPGIL